MANTGFKVQGADLGDMYLTYTDLAALYPTIASPVRRTSMDTTDTNTPIESLFAGSVDRIFGGFRNGAVIKTDGTLWMWGYNTGGQLGDGTTTSSSNPVQVSGAGRWVHAVPGGNSVWGIKSDGTMWAWGSQGTVNSTTPVQQGTANDWRIVSTTHGLATAALKTNGTLWFIGQGIYGATAQNSTATISTFTQVFGGGTNWKFVKMHNYGGHAIKTDGTLWGWGYNAGGELGDNTRVDKSSPVQTITGGNNWKQVTYPHQSSLGSNVLALKTDGTLWGWGKGSYSTVGSSSPVQILAGTTWTEVFGATSLLSNSIAAARRIDGTILRWSGDDIVTPAPTLTSITPPNNGKWQQFAASNQSGYIGSYDDTIAQ